MDQKIIKTESELADWLQDKLKTLLVCDGSMEFLAINNFFSSLESRQPGKIAQFSDFQPNPDYSSVVAGVEKFRVEGCDSIIAIGGGSAMDVAKCIKLYHALPGDGSDGEWLKTAADELERVCAQVAFLAMPTTAGTGSEATRYAVVYYEGNKQSITSTSIMPDTVLMDSSVLRTLPLYQKKSTMLDALCHAIESYWSVNSTDESKKYSKEAIEAIIANTKSYLNNESAGNEAMLLAAHTAGKAINITQTTAGHAMCYKVSSMFGVSHGHAVALCVRKLWPMMLKHAKSGCSDPRGAGYLLKTFNELADILGTNSAAQAAWKFNKIFLDLDLNVPHASFEQVRELANEVNPVRLKNNPVEFKPQDFIPLYEHSLDPKEALTDKILILLSEALIKFFNTNTIHYDKEATPEEIMASQQLKKRIRREFMDHDKVLGISEFKAEKTGHMTFKIDLQRNGEKIQIKVKI